MSIELRYPCGLFVIVYIISYGFIEFCAFQKAKKALENRGLFK